MIKRLETQVYCGNEMRALTLDCIHRADPAAAGELSVLPMYEVLRQNWEMGEGNLPLIWTAIKCARPRQEGQVRPHCKLWVRQKVASPDRVCPHKQTRLVFSFSCVREDVSKIAYKIKLASFTHLSGLCALSCPGGCRSTLRGSALALAQV